MAEPITLTAVYETGDDGWVYARLAEWPAVQTAGRSVDEARALLRDAFREMVLSYTDDGEQPPVGEGVIREPLELTIS